MNFRVLVGSAALLGFIVSGSLLSRSAGQHPVKDEKRTKSAAALKLEADPELRTKLNPGSKFDELKNNLKKAKIDGQQFWVTEGDRLLDEDELFFYAAERQAQLRLFEARRAAGSSPPPGAMELVAVTENGRVVRWEPGKVLTYCVLKSLFSDNDKYQMVVDNMLKATGDWEATCGVKFEHKSDLDNSPGTDLPDGVLFCVRQIDANGSFIAASFFPNDPPLRRKLVIDPSYYTTSFDKIGVLRHELGHILGFRHEHIRSEAPPVCQGEGVDNTLNLTDYDPRSVMHYFCGGVGTRELRITQLDQTGSQLIYGPPLLRVQFVK
jgi:hypothetical protein